MFWLNLMLQHENWTQVLNRSAAAVSVKLTEGPEASRHSAEQLSNMTENEEKDQIVTDVETGRYSETFPGVGGEIYQCQFNLNST